MKIKISLILITCLVFSMFSSLVKADQGVSEENDKMEELIVAVKQIIEIPESYTEFSYSSNTTEIFGKQITNWNFNWLESGDTGNNISVTIDNDKNFKSYNHYVQSDKKGLGNISTQAAQKTALEFLNQVIPLYSNRLKQIENNYYNSSNTYQFEYKLFVNDIQADFTSVTVNVDKYTGKVTSFNAVGLECKSEYPAKANIIDIDKAKSNYLSKIGINLKYQSYYDYKNKKLNIFTAYSIDDTNKFIDAKTGEPIYIEPSFPELYALNSSRLSADSDESMPSLTKEELDAVLNNANLISKEKAESIFKETLNIEDSNLNNISLNKSQIDNTYIWDLAFDNIYGSIDAKTGELLSFYYITNNEIQNNISEQDAYKLAQEFLTKITPNKFKQTKYKPTQKSNIQLRAKAKEYSFSFIRQVNGIDFADNSLNILVDGNGKIISYNSTWYDIAFPQISKKISSEDAFNVINKDFDFNLAYVILDDNSSIGLVYKFLNSNISYLIEPIDGNKIDYRGTKYKDNKIPKYTDIDSHWCKPIVTKLLENGYYLEGDKFLPDQEITQIDFFKYLYSNTNSSYTDDEFYEMLINRKIIKKEEKSPNSNIKFKDAAKFAVRYLNYEEIANNPQIFKNPFKDNISDEYLGYAAICYSLGIIDNTEFNENTNITKAQAAQIIYNILNIKINN